jgi:hypothetical protein
LAIQYWGLYSIVNEQDKFISEIWDREVLRLSFRRTVDRALMTQWEELTQIVNCIHLSDEEDVIVWHYTSSCVYSAQSIYAIVNNRGVRQIYTPVVWKILIPPKPHIFLWLMANNKVLTRDNLAKSKHLDDKACLFCEEAELVTHIT